MVTLLSLVLNFPFYKRSRREREKRVTKQKREREMLAPFAPMMVKRHLRRRIAIRAFHTSKSCLGASAFRDGR